MPYCTQDNILAMVDEETLVSITDDDDTGSVDADVIAAAIADADAAIDTYLVRQYTVPMASPVPDMVRKLSVDVSLYNLYSRRNRVPESVEQRFKDAVVTLRDIAAGKAGIPGAVDAPSDQSDNGVAVTSGTRIFTRATMEGF